ncbi:aspartate/methionine/tyrosine aminotransferase [Actinoalloteichus hoggarensis]|uniref:Aminotransferase n=1 Tax=Actinoalloteichus hoggarensis TaxID=1470176 RepID=A0A221WBJ9_9PSEU|nr:aminotransferase class I/II-fold pyridoxal phosphate-dependent enzyme [Actinoalloteichus hoggarensis]ASO23021.1 Aspartate aminotransferase [Actinoalloteichus hoggarensis]MBB5922626.1 aspartate/methionine/tyrosine aminotransferase [Actinoalloteichus hoggarensis]
MSAALDPLRAATRAQVPPFYVMNVVSAAARRAREHGDVVSLVAGQPSTPAPGPVRAAAAEALATTSLGYTEQLGTRELRTAVAGHYRTRYDLTVDPEEVVITSGASGAFLLAFLACFEAGDRVALARPGYPAYRNILRALGCEVVELPTGPETRFQPTAAMLAALDEPVRGLIVASPANPSGSVVSPEELRALSDWCGINGVRLISDEIYHGISYGARTASARQFTPDAVVVHSFSKYWSMTGWRLGWALVPEGLRSAVAALAGNFTVCPSSLAQQAALAAFTPESYAEADAQVVRYRTNRDLLLRGLAELGIARIAPADGAFYVYADVSHLTDDSMGFCERLLADTGVAVVPGIDFDPVDGGRFVRMSVAGSTEDVAEALRRLGPWLDRG